MKSILKEFKENNKAKALSIKALKARVNSAQKDGADTACRLQSELHELRQEFRHKHIAYCLLRGRNLNEIENNPGRISEKRRVIKALLLYLSESQASRIAEEAFSA